MIAFLLLEALVILVHYHMWLKNLVSLLRTTDSMEEGSFLSQTKIFTTLLKDLISIRTTLWCLLVLLQMSSNHTSVWIQAYGLRTNTLVPCQVWLTPIHSWATSSALSEKAKTTAQAGALVIRWTLRLLLLAVRRSQETTISSCLASEQLPCKVSLSRFALSVSLP